MNIKIFIWLNIMLFAVPMAWGLFSLDLTTSLVDMGSNLNPESSPIDKSSAVTAIVKNSDAIISWSLQTYAAGDISSSVKSTTIPIEQLQFKGGDLISFTSFQATPAIQIETGADEAGVGTFNVVMDYRLILYWNNVAASDYKATIWYTLTGE